MRTHVWQIWLSALVASALTFGQSAITEPKLIAYAKGLDVSRLDSTLPKQALDKWFSAQGIAEDKLIWRRSDCDLMPSFDKPNEPRPLCVAFVITVASDTGVFGKIFVGTDQKWIDGPPKFGRMHMSKGPWTPRSSRARSDCPSCRVCLRWRARRRSEPTGECQLQRLEGRARYC